MTLFEEPIDAPVDSLQIYMAVRHVGYWVDGFISLAASRNSVVIKAADALKTVIAKATAGRKCSDLVSLAAEKIRPYNAHTITAGNIGNGIGLSLEEEPKLLSNSEDTLEEGGVYTLRVGGSDGRKDHGIVSAMVAVHQDGNELLWTAI